MAIPYPTYEISQNAPSAEIAVQQAPQTVDEAFKLDPAFILSKVEYWVVGFQKLLPNIVVAVIAFGLAIIVAWIAEQSFRKWAGRRDPAISARSWDRS